MNRLLRALPALVALALVLAGCQTSRIAYIPRIDQPRQTEWGSEPLYISIADERPEQRHGEELEAALREGLGLVYNHARFVDDPAQVPAGARHVQIEVHALGATRGRRAVAHPETDPSAVAVLSSRAGNAPREGRAWWFGQSLIHLRARLGGLPERRIERRLYSEHTILNLLGRRSGEHAARMAWRGLEPDLLRFIGEVASGRAGRRS